MRDSSLIEEQDTEHKSSFDTAAQRRSIYGGESGPVKITALVGSGFCIAAGVYLMGFQSAGNAGFGGADTTWFEIIAHGMGLYFIGKGLLMCALVWQSSKIGQSL